MPPTRCTGPRRADGRDARDRSARACRSGGRRVRSPAVSSYVASNWGLLGFAESLQQELRGTRIRVSVVLPATMDTPIYQHAANVTGRRVHPLPPVSSPERAARAIARAAHRPHRTALVGRTQAAVIPVHRLSRRLYDPLVGWLMDAVELRGSGVEPTTGTVFDAPRTAGRTSGGWRSSRPALLAGFAGAALLLGTAVARGRR
ncbi:SDR family NAD(P)-dependent oxidoreductase [Microbacterium kyungheense]|uniref:SDR family NAD(P)-dependent oxidoreductase n=1 Tax=Microbacterium kyungheense TaxID=1263636 RepID=UPI003CCC4BB6